MSEPEHQASSEEIRKRTERFLEAAKAGKFDEPSSPEKKPSRGSDYLKATVLIGFVLFGMLAMGGFALFNIARRIDDRAISLNPEVPKTVSPETLWFLKAFDTYPWVGILLVLMLADIITGLLAGIIAKRLSSKISWAGMAKKSIVLILVGVSAVVESQTNGIPLAKLVASAFTVSELISIVENASRSGIIIPKPLADYITSVIQKPKPPEPIHVDKVEKIEVHQHVDPPK